MRRIFLNCGFALCAATMILSSCERTTELEMAITITPDISSPEFDATIEDGFSKSSSTRTAISTTPNAVGNYFLTWNSGDEISISEGTNVAVYTTKESNQTASFTKKSGYISNTASKYVAFYPASLTPKNQKLPATQEYVSGDVKNYPMYAESNGYELSFKNLCGILRLSLSNTDKEREVSVKSISVSVDGQGLSGNFTVDESYAAVVSGADGVVLNCSTPVAIGTQSSDFNMVMPKGVYAAMKIKITDKEGKVVNLEGQSPVTVNRSGITKVNVALKAANFTNGLEIITFTESDVEFTER